MSESAHEPTPIEVSGDAVIEVQGGLAEGHARAEPAPGSGPTPLPTDVVKLTLNVTREAVTAIEKIAEHYGLSPTDAVHRALANELARVESESTLRGRASQFVKRK